MKTLISCIAVLAFTCVIATSDLYDPYIVDHKLIWGDNGVYKLDHIKELVKNHFKGEDVILRTINFEEAKFGVIGFLDIIKQIDSLVDNNC